MLEFFNMRCLASQSTSQGLMSDVTLARLAQSDLVCKKRKARLQRRGPVPTPCLGLFQFFGLVLIKRVKTPGAGGHHNPTPWHDVGRPRRWVVHQRLFEGGIGGPAPSLPGLA